MSKASVIDSSRYSALIDERLKLKSKERLRPSNLFSEPYYQNSDSEKRYIDKMSENTCKNMFNICNKNNENVKGIFSEIQCIDDMQFNDRTNLEVKDNYKYTNYEKEQENKLEEYIKNTSAREQKLFREFSTGIVLGDEDNSRVKMVSYVSSVLNHQKIKEDDNIRKYRLIYPSYSNIFNDEFLSIHTELSKEQPTLKGSGSNHSDIGDDCAAMLLTPDTLKYYTFDRKTKTYNYIKDSRNNLISNEYNLDNLVKNFTPQQKNLSSKLHGSEFYNKAAIRNSETVYMTRFRLKNITSEIDEKTIQSIAASCGLFANQISFEFDPIRWSLKGTATGTLRYSGNGFEFFKKKLLEQFSIGVEIIGVIQEDLLNIKTK